MLRLREDPINEHFFPFFYDHCINIMFKPLLEVPEWKKLSGACYIPHAMRHAEYGL